MLGDPVAIREFLDAAGRSLFARWFDSLNETAAAKVAGAVYRLGQWNFSNVVGVGAGVYELKLARSSWAEHKRRRARP